MFYVHKIYFKHMDEIFLDDYVNQDILVVIRYFLDN